MAYMPKVMQPATTHAVVKAWLRKTSRGRRGLRLRVSTSRKSPTEAAATPAQMRDDWLPQPQ